MFIIVRIHSMASIPTWTWIHRWIYSIFVHEFPCSKLLRQASNAYWIRYSCIRLDIKSSYHFQRGNSSANSPWLEPRSLNSQVKCLLMESSDQSLWSLDFLLMISSPPPPPLTPPSSGHKATPSERPYLSLRPITAHPDLSLHHGVCAVDLTLFQSFTCSGTLFKAQILNGRLFIFYRIMGFA